MTRTETKRRDRRAFSLIELLAVMAIIVILASMVTVTAVSFYQKAQVTRTKATITMLAAALESFRADYGAYPFHDPRAYALESRPARPGDADVVDKTVDTATYDIRNLYGLLRETGYLKEPVESKYISVETEDDVKDNDYDHIVLDAWETPLAYRYPRWDDEAGEWKEDRFDLWSAGPDRRPARSAIAEEFDPLADGSEDDIFWGRF